MMNIYNVADVAKILNLSKSCIYKKFECGELQGFKIGSVIRFTEENIHNFLEACKSNSQTNGIDQKEDHYVYL